MPSRRIALSASVLAAAGLVGSSVTQQAFAAPADGSNPAAGKFVAGQTSVRTVVVNGVQRSYRVHMPAGYTRGIPTPLVLAFHARSQSAVEFEHVTGLTRLPAITVFPDGLRSAAGPQSWQGAPYANPRADDIGFTRAILSQVGAEASVDRGRVFLIGRSNGGSLTNLLTCRMPGRFRAMALISSAFYPQAEAGCGGTRPVSTIVFHGTADPIVPYLGAVKFGNQLQPVPAYLNQQARRAGCQKPVTRSAGGNVTRIDWPLCRSGAMITHLRFNGGGHGWPHPTYASLIEPGQRVNTSSLIWQFFQARAVTSSFGS
ncbi:alpha/beta hydrolase family esterase [Gordonia sp. (in: high G+C Gram-positive bacteria)]|uniref:alpha/beta hydrolase family esterase n=1 Tax=Gordonia sp. (in: high G+C Gram-positive bacteria) TaxID=84139 RepID=UPI0039E28205